MFVHLEGNTAEIRSVVNFTETSDEVLDDRISDFLDMSGTPNVEVVGFVEYPDRSAIGSSTGTIRVQEQLSTGRFVQRDYTVDFEIKSSF